MSQEPDPEVPGVPVTALNWQDPPGNRWTFWHVGELLPTYRVSRGDGPARELPRSAAADQGAAEDLLAIAVTRADGSAGTVDEVLADTFTDAYLMLQDGKLVTEWYGPLGAPDRPHALMSVSKSVLGCVAAVLIDRGQLDPDREITGYVPELAASGYAGALVRHVLDMRSGVRFLEEYANPHSDIRRLDEWVGWQPGQGEPRGLYRFLATLQAEAPHGERFLYRSAESDVLGWVCERAASRPMAELMSELIWAPMGAGGRRRPAARWPGRRRARRGPVRHRPRRGPVRPAAAGRRAGPGRDTEHPPGRAAPVAPPGLGRRRRHAGRVRRVARRVGLSRRVVPAPVLVPPGRLRRRAALPGHPRPDGACEPAHEHGLREVLHLAGGAEPGLPGGHAARLQRRRRLPGRPGSRPAPPGRRGLRPEPQRRHGPTAPRHRRRP